MKVLKLFKINNEGNTIPAALLIAVILTFIITSLSKESLTFAKTTNNDYEKVSTYSVAKGSIDISMSEFRDYINATSDFVAFENNEVPRLKDAYGVDIINDSDSFDLSPASYETYVYKFSYTVDGNAVSKHAFISIGGTTTDVFYPYDFSVATAGDLVLNSAVVLGDKIYGENTYLYNHSLYENNLFFDQKEITPENSPFWTYFFDYEDRKRESSFLYSNNFKYCTNNCFDTTYLYDPWVMNKDNYKDIDEDFTGTKPAKDDIIVEDFFSDFDYDTKLFDTIKNYAPTDNLFLSENIDYSNLSTVLQNNSKSVPLNKPKKKDLLPFYDYDQSYFNSNYILQYSGYVNGDLTFKNDVNFEDIKNNDYLIIDGNLTIDGPLSISGTYIVLGDLKFVSRSIDTTATFYVTGQTIIDFDYNHGFDTPDYTGMSIISKDNILFLNHFSNTSTFPKWKNNEKILAVFYTEESIYINGAFSHINSEGTMMAEAKGNGTPLNFLENDLYGNELKGIIINSYNGYLKQDGWNYLAVPESNSQDVDNARIIFRAYSKNNFFNDFTNLPPLEPVVFSQEGVYTFETSEFHYD